MKGAEADGGNIMENRQSGDSRNIEQLSYKSALCGRDKSMKVLPFPDAAHRLSWSAYRFSTIFIYCEL